MSSSWSSLVVVIVTNSELLSGGLSLYYQFNHRLLFLLLTSAVQSNFSLPNSNSNSNSMGSSWINYLSAPVVLKWRVLSRCSIIYTWVKLTNSVGSRGYEKPAHDASWANFSFSSSSKLALHFTTMTRITHQSGFHWHFNFVIRYHSNRTINCAFRSNNTNQRLLTTL